MPTIFAHSFSPLLLATLTQLFRQGRRETSRAMTKQAMRLMFWLLPFAGLAAGASSEIVGLIYDNRFLPAAQLLALLMFAAIGLAMITITTGILTAGGRPGWTFALTGPLVPLALAGHYVLVPRYGALGAAVVTTTVAWLGAGLTMLAIYRLHGVAPAPLTIFRTILTTLIAYALSSIWRSSGAWVILELSAIAAIIVICLFGLGKLTRQDLAFARSLLKRERRTSR